MVQIKSNGRKIHLFCCYVRNKQKANKRKIAVARSSAVRDARAVDSIIIIGKMWWEHMFARRLPHATLKMHLVCLTRSGQQRGTWNFALFLSNSTDVDGVVTHAFHNSVDRMGPGCLQPAHGIYLIYKITNSLFILWTLINFKWIYYPRLRYS